MTEKKLADLIGNALKPKRQPFFGTNLKPVLIQTAVGIGVAYIVFSLIERYWP